ncbi:MAG TPA: FtsX-like permease family protein [Candidatus Methylomirabilis sp.]|nr:FtsX-like permease family protein [Candidatus Methylomirabilis sp.]
MTAGVHRHLRILRYLAGSLRRRWRKNVAVVWVYGLVIFILASVVFLTQSLTHESVAALDGAPEIMLQRLQTGRHGLTPVQDAGALLRIAGVRAAYPRLWAYHGDGATGETLLLRVPDGTRLRQDEARAGAELLRRRGIPVGGSLSLRGHAGEPLVLTISGVAQTSTPLESAALVNVSEAAFRALTGMPEGQATDLVLRVRNRRELATIATKIGEGDSAARPIIRDELVRTYTSVLNWRSGVIIAALLVPVLAFILFAWDKAAGLSPDERREIGILKAIGWETSDVILLKCYEALAVSLAAFLLGGALALTSLARPHPLAVLPALLGWSTLYPPFRPGVGVGPYQVATLFFLVVFPYLVATVIPAWRAATTDPDLVMRS